MRGLRELINRANQQTRRLQQAPQCSHRHNWQEFRSACWLYAAVRGWLDTYYTILLQLSHCQHHYAVGCCMCFSRTHSRITNRAWRGSSTRDNASSITGYPGIHVNVLWGRFRKRKNKPLPWYSKGTESWPLMTYSHWKARKLTCNRSFPILYGTTDATRL